MADRYRTPGGWSVEVVQLAAGERLRIRHHGFYIADVRTIAELERWIPAAELDQLQRDTLTRTGQRDPRSASPGCGAAGASPTCIPRSRVLGHGEYEPERGLAVAWRGSAGAG
jgi:hypothetical protein